MNRDPDIKTSYINPPIPTKAFIWVAYRDGNEEDGPFGNGATEDDAIKDLIWNEEMAARQAEYEGVGYWEDDENNS